MSREVLTRLLKLNHARHAAEVAAGLHDKKRGKRKSKRKQQTPPDDESGQMKLLRSAKVASNWSRE